ncbi:toll/interleukin-1 receptor domain-containing protein, partial [Vibrio vulnificus]|nr:toll/interleukin-1 receptor domain-containing protein [Vibrio vulnificus]
MKQLFLSHIHEEKELAILIKEAIENEFSGFVDVFVSSDGISIPAGANFLKRIEDGLVGSIGAMYLISPKSVNRNWINFELGAMWIRNAMSIRGEGREIPTLPLCHSGMQLQNLPKPIDNLNAIVANQASQLEFAFRSIQAAVGGKGSL